MEKITKIVIIIGIAFCLIGIGSAIANTVTKFYPVTILQHEDRVAGFALVYDFTVNGTRCIAVRAWGNNGVAITCDWQQGK